MIARSPEPLFNIEVAQGLLNIEQIVVCLLLVALLTVLWGELEGALRTLFRSVSGVLFAGLFFLGLFGWMAYSFGMEGLPMALGLAAGCALSIASPSFALCFASAVLLLRPWEILGGQVVMLALPRIFSLLLVVSWLVAEARTRSLRIRFGWEEAVMAAFVFWAYMSVFVAPNWSASHSDFLGNYTRSFVVYFLVLQIIRTPKHVFALSATIGICGAALAILTGYRMGFDPLLSTRGRAELFGLLGDPNDLSAMLLFALPPLVYAIDRLPISLVARRAVEVTVALAATWTIWMTQSRGAIVGLVCLLLGWGLTRLRSLRQVAVLSGLGLGVGALLMTTLQRSASDLGESQASRLSYWGAGWEMVIRNPVMGVGFGGYPYRFSEFVKGGANEIGMRTAHSSWILVMAETGFVGFLLYGGLFWLAGRRAWQLRYEYPYLFPALAGYGGAATFLSHTYLLQPYLLLGIVFAAYRARLDDVPELAAVLSEPDLHQAGV